MRAADDHLLKHLAEEAELVRAARARRDASLTPSQRLERVHELCRQLAAIRPVREARH
jgi:hypothetical protein